MMKVIQLSGLLGSLLGLVYGVGDGFLFIITYRSGIAYTQDKAWSILAFLH